MICSLFSPFLFSDLFTFLSLSVHLSLLVMRMLITLSGWSQSLLLIGTGVMFLIFIMSGCEQLVRCPTHIAGNRLDLVMTDAPDIVDVFVLTPLGTSDHCLVSCVFQVEQSVLEYNVRSTVFRKHRTNWDNVHSAVRSFAWITILKLADPLDGDRANCEVIGVVTVLHGRSGDKQWFDASCRRAYDVKQTAYR